MSADTLETIVAASASLDEAEARLLLLDEKRRRDRYIAYWEPTPDQRQFWDQRIYDKKYWIILGGERSGKTELGAFLATVWLLGKEYFRNEPAWKWVEPLPVPDHPCIVRAVGLTADMSRDVVWEKLMGASQHASMFPQDGSIVKSSDHELTAEFTTKSKFHTKSADAKAKTHGGTSIDLVHIDEECDYEIWRMNEQRTVTTGGKILATLTPHDDPSAVAHPWVYDLLESWRGNVVASGTPVKEDIGVIFLKSLANPHTPDAEKRRLVQRFKGLAEATARLDGIPTVRSGLYYKRWKSEPPLWTPAYDLPVESTRVCFVDPAVTGYVGALWAAFDRRGKMTLYRAYKEKGLPVSRHVENILTLCGDDPIRFWWADPWMSRQKIPDATARTTDDNKTVIQVWRDAGLHRLLAPEINYTTALALSHEYIEAAWDPTAPNPAVEVFDHLDKFEWEIQRYVIDSVAQGPNRGESRDRPRKGRDGASTLMELFQYCCAMKMRARDFDRPLHSAVPKSANNYFA